MLICLTYFKSRQQLVLFVQRVNCLMFKTMCLRGLLYENWIYNDYWVLCIHCTNSLRITHLYAILKQLFVYIILTLLPNIHFAYFQNCDSQKKMILLLCFHIRWYLHELTCVREGHKLLPTTTLIGITIFVFVCVN